MLSKKWAKLHPNQMAQQLELVSCAARLHCAAISLALESARVLASGFKT